jgi:hypothetical protein
MKRERLNELSQLRVEHGVRATVDATSAVEPGKAIASLLKGRSVYDNSGSTTVAPFVYGRVSVPSDVKAAPLLIHQLPDADSILLKGFVASQQRSAKEQANHAEVFGSAGCHTDPRLLKRPEDYSRLIRQCMKIGLVRLTLFCKCDLGVFFVIKKNGTLRMIVDCRKANLCFVDPPGVDLVTGEGLSGIEIGDECTEGGFSSAEMAGCFERLRLAMGVGDVADCFHRCRLEGELCHYFCWPSIKAKYLGVSSVEGRDIDPETRVWPMHCSLPMGFSWSLYFAQKCVDFKFSQIPELSGAHVLSDRGSVWVLCRGNCLARWVYVDNLGVLGDSVERVEVILAAATATFDADGLDLHQVEVHESGGPSLGIIIDCELLQTRNTEKRHGILTQGINAVLSMRKVRGWVLEVLIGHCNFFGLISRESISIFYASNKFVQKYYFEPAVLWPSVRNELLAFKGIMPLIVGE